LAKQLNAMEEEELLVNKANDPKGIKEPLIAREPSGENRLVKANTIMEIARALSRKLSLR
jgi:hypothetical protein